MAKLEKPKKRVAFVLNTLTGNELIGGNRDVARIFEILTDPNLGMCSLEHSKPIYQCKSKNEFLDNFSSILENLVVGDQLIFYFSGHGIIKGEQYCLKLGHAPKDFYPFKNIITDLEACQIYRAILIIDACYSGAALRTKDSKNSIHISGLNNIPKGIAILASSRASENSYELADGSSSVFTDLLINGIRTGLDGECTDDGYITVGDIIGYIKNKLEYDPTYLKFTQRPVFNVSEADRSIWITKNPCGSKAVQNITVKVPKINTVEELEFLYKKTLHTLHPCLTASIDDLDWELIEQYASKIHTDLYKNYSQDILLTKLNLFSPISHLGRNVLHMSAVLSFHKRPELFYPQAKSIFVVGNPGDDEFTREDVTGPLSLQVKMLLEKTKKHIEKISYIGDDGLRKDTEEIDINVIRELISNAITHRDYNLNHRVTITITPEALEIRSPGKFPPGTSWETFLKSRAPVSCPINAAISQYLSNLLAFEGIGRGFEIFKKYIEKNGLESIVHIELPGPTTLIRILRKKLQKLRSAYLDYVFSITRSLSLMGIDPKAASEAETRLDINAVYIELLTISFETDKFSQKEKESDFNKYQLSAIEQLNRHKHLVLLGDPGSGKSTFVNFVALCMAGEFLGKKEVNLSLFTAPIHQNGNKNELKQHWDHGALIPIRIILRDFAVRALPAKGEKATANHIWNFIVSELHSFNMGDYSKPLKQEMSEKGCLLLFDGLDEVSEAEKRRTQIKNAIEDFSAAFPMCRILVTSRIYAYQKQDWRLSGFTDTILAPFNENQVLRFIDRWYSHIGTIRGLHKDDVQGRAELLKRSISNNNQLQELAGRPLLLTLMASLHAWRGGSLPDNREVLYADTVDLLLDSWESSKVVRDLKGTIRVQQPSLAEWLRVDKQKLREILNEIAFTVHAAQPDLMGTADISEANLIGWILKESQNPDVKPARLIEYLSQRAGLLLPRGMGIYAFPHRTFQEYLAACYLTDHDFPDFLAELVEEDANRWREVVLLAGAKAARGSSSTIWLLVEALCYENPEKKIINLSSMWRSHLAGQALVEIADLNNVSKRHEPKVERVKKWLIEIMKQDNFPAFERVVAGNNLALLGDPRPEISNLKVMQFCYIPNSDVWIGSADHDALANEEEKPLHKLNLPHDFWISRYPITVAQFYEFIKSANGYRNDEWWTKSGLKFRENKISIFENSFNFNLPNHPIVMVCWYEAIAFTRWLTFTLQNEGILENKWIIRLPSELEWEKTARGGIDIPETPVICDVSKLNVPNELKIAKNKECKRFYPWGDDLDNNYVNYLDTGIGTTSPLSCFFKGVSPYGCLEMSGNVWEWTRNFWGKDWLKTDYCYPYNEHDGREIVDINESNLCIARGGSFNDSRKNIRISSRGRFSPNHKSKQLGFRVVISLS